MFVNYLIFVWEHSEKIKESKEKKIIINNSIKMLLTVSGFKAPTDSTLKKNLLGTFVGSNGASDLSSGNSKHHWIIELIIFLNFYLNVPNVAILQVQDKQYVEDYYLDHIQMKHPRKIFYRHIFIRKIFAYTSWNPFCMFFPETFSCMCFQSKFLSLSKFNNQNI